MHRWPHYDPRWYGLHIPNRRCDAPHRHGDSHAHADSHPDAHPHGDGVSMSMPSPQSGPKFGDLIAGGGPMSEGEGSGSAEAAGPTPMNLGPELSNDPAQEAIKTNPIQQARIASAMSRERLQKLAIQMKQAREALV